MLWSSLKASPPDGGLAVRPEAGQAVDNATSSGMACACLIPPVLCPAWSDYNPDNKRVPGRA